MATDNTEHFKKNFITECFELLGDAENLLLEINIEAPSLDDLNAIFRCAHSIKGGAGIFGMDNIVKFTHVIETLLDLLRDSKILLDKNIVDILLKANDIISNMVNAASKDEKLSDDYGNEVIEQVNQILNLNNKSIKSHSNTTKEIKELPKNIKVIKQYSIDFIPSQELLRSGNEPYIIIKALSNLGIISVRCEYSSIPNLNEIDPFVSYLKWQIDLESEIDVREIEEIFEFVSDVAQVKITQISEIEIPIETKELTQQTNSVIQDNDILQEDKKTLDKETKSTSAMKNTNTIRVDTDKIDKLVNMVGELVITQSMLYNQAKKLPSEYHAAVIHAIEELSQHSRELQEAVMSVRMQPVKSLFSRMPRLVRDLANQLNKDIKLEMYGEQTEIDKTVIEQLNDPLMHMIRNSADHGIEKPEDRIAKGKQGQGIITLSAANRGGKIIIEISDDGAGINREKVLKKAIEKGLVSSNVSLSGEEIDNLIFLAGFSTADVVSNISGRGVGMDVVKRNIEGLGGSVSIKSEFGKGSNFIVSLPLTLAILDGMIIRVGEEKYIIPIENIVETLSVNKDDINEISQGNRVLNIRGEFISIIELSNIFSIKALNEDKSQQLIVLVESINAKFGLVVDELLGQQQVVIKSLEENSNPIDGISGATILGDGKVSLILDISKIPTIHQKNLIKDNPREKSIKIEEC